MKKPTATFGKIDEQYAQFNTAEILLQPIPYDGASTWGKGADKGFDSFLEAAEHLELYDIETDFEVYKRGIHILDPVEENNSSEAVYKAVYAKAKELLETGKFLTFFGGDHSVSIGILKAFYEAHPGITILQLDAHTDLRPEYRGSPYNHACALHEASRHAHLVQVGIRSMDAGELEYFNRDNCYFAEEIQDQTGWMEESISKMNRKVYITLDMDVFDPSEMPSTGTPEPGGLRWDVVIQYLRRVFDEKDVLGFDMVELAPIENMHAPNFLAAKLYYKMLSYKFY